MEGDEDGGEKKIDNEAGDGLSLLSGSDGGDDEETFSSDKVNNKVRVYWKWDPPPHYESILSHFFRNYVLNEAPTYYSFWFGLQAVCWGKTRLKLVHNCV